VLILKGPSVLQPQFLTVLNPEEQVAASHPLRAIRKFCDEALRALSPTFEERHSDFGRAFIAPQPSGGRFETPSAGPARNPASEVVVSFASHSAHQNRSLPVRRAASAAKAMPQKANS
jgi:hypothetical protein